MNCDECKQNNRPLYHIGFGCYLCDVCILSDKTNMEKFAKAAVRRKRKQSRKINRIAFQ